MPSERDLLEQRVLLLAPTERDGDASRKVLSGAGIDCVLVTSLTALIAELERGAGAMIVPEETVTADINQHLSRAIHSQPVWSDVPTIVLSRAGVETPAGSRAVATLGNVTLVERPLRVTTLVSVVKTALRARERQYQVRNYLAEQIRAEGELRRSRERLALALDAARLGAWSANLATGEMDCSDRCLDNLGLPHHTHLNLPQFMAMVHADDRDHVQAAIDHGLKTNSIFESEFRVAHPGQPIRWIFASARGEYGQDGKPFSMLGVSLDITVRKQNEEALRIARDTAESANRAKDRFLAVLSHELRTPLTPVMLAAALLERQSDLSDASRTSVAMIRRNVDLECRLIDDLLDLSRVISGKLNVRAKPLYAHELLKSTLQYCASGISSKRIKIVEQYDAKNDYLNGDTARLQQVFWNLLSNATKFTPEGGEISIRTWNTEPGRLVVQVKDSGVGIPANVIDRIFDAFEQGDSRVTHQFGGLGLGLAIAKAVVDLHGGSITATSDGKDNGSCFTVELSTIAPAGAEAVPLTNGKPKPASASARVLLVEDHGDTAEVMRSLLTAMGHRVIVADTASGALDLAARETFDIVVSDIGLPDATGYELMAKLKATHPLPGIALSGYGMEEDIQRSRRAGFTDHLVKPVDIAALESVIRKVVASTGA